jgi:hypothetical protein
MLEPVVLEVIVPPVIVHAYVAPALLGTDAMFPVEFAQTTDAPVTVALIGAVIVTALDWLTVIVPDCTTVTSTS